MLSQCFGKVVCSSQNDVDARECERVGVRQRAVRQTTTPQSYDSPQNKLNASGSVTWHPEHSRHTNIPAQVFSCAHLAVRQKEKCLIG